MTNELGFAENLVYGVNEVDGFIRVEPIQNLVPDEVCLAQGIALAQLGRFVFTDAALGHDGLVFELPNRSWDCNQMLEKRGRLRHPRMQGFWDFTAEKLTKRSWLSQSPFSHALHELQFRYNHREKDTCDRIVDILIQPAPEKGTRGR